MKVFPLINRWILAFLALVFAVAAYFMFSAGKFQDADNNNSGSPSMPVPFSAASLYRIEGTVEARPSINFFVVNKGTGNEQRIKLSSLLDMVDGAQYAICLKLVRDCFFECEGEVVGKPVFITPDQDPALLITNSEMVYEPASKSQCP